MDRTRQKQYAGGVLGDGGLGVFSAVAFSHASRAVVAVGVVLCALLVLSISFGPRASAADLKVSYEGAFFATSVSQANLAQCVSSVKNTKVHKEGKDKAIREIEVSFSQENECEGVTLTVNVVDKDGEISAGSLPELPVGTKDKVNVKLTGEAARNDKPTFYFNIA
ncbi:MAG: hypothetical protein WA988_16055 [Candidatus Nanopelagicales bacterium]